MNISREAMQNAVRPNHSYSVLSWNLGIPLQAHQLRIFVPFPVCPELDQIKTTVRTEFHIHRLLEGEVRGKGTNGNDVAVAVELHCADPVPHPLIYEERIV